MMQKYTLQLCAALALAAGLTPPALAQAGQQFAVSYDAELTVDPKRASNTGLSQTAINTVWGLMGGSVSIADVHDTISFSREAYHIRSVGTLGRLLSTFISNGTFTRDSVGRIGSGTLHTLRYIDTRGTRPPLTTLVDEKSKTIFFYDGKAITRRTPYQASTQDVLSLTYAFIGRVPSKPVSVALSDGKAIKQATFDVHSEPLKLAAGQWNTIKLTRRVSDRDDASVECWLRATDGVPLRVRIGMNQRYGAVLDLKVTKVPTKIPSY